MQPYFLPYIGYFQLMWSVDVFVLLDDVQYINRGWVNRNRIRGHENSVWLTLPVRNASRTLCINQRYYLLSDRDVLEKVGCRLHASYRKAPFYEEVLAVVMKSLRSGEDNVATVNTTLLENFARQLGIRCRFERASQVGNPDQLKGQARVLDLCRRMGATHYINPIGGVALYDASQFAKKGIALSFLQTSVAPVGFPTGNEHLSILDSLMMRGPTETAALLSQVCLSIADEG